MKSGTIFDNILITDDENYASEFLEETYGVTKDPEKKMRQQVRKFFFSSSLNLFSSLPISEWVGVYHIITRKKPCIEAICLEGYLFLFGPVTRQFSLP